jgi:predicted ATP-grasp superfamily ATP-dependent carboligase
MNLTTFLARSRETTPAVVLFSGNATGIGLLRALGRHGVPLAALDCVPDSIALRSRYAYGELTPDVHHEEEPFIAGLVGLGRQLPRRALLIPSHDDYVDCIPRHHERLSEWFLLQQPPPERMRSLLTKEEQVRAAWRAGVDTPRTLFIRTRDDIDGAAGEMRFPAILKPAVPLAFRREMGAKVVRVASHDELAPAFARVERFGTSLLQEFVPGEDDMLYNYGSYFNARSEPLAECTRRKLRQHPKTFGELRFGESVWVPEVAAAGRALLQELGYYGMSSVEFKLDARDGRYKLMEVNARSTLMSHTLMPKLGVDVPWVAYRDAIGEPITAGRQTGDGTRCIQWSYDLPDSLAEIAHGELDPLDWLRSLRRIRCDGIMALDDPVPGALDMSRMLRREVAKRLRRLASPDRGRAQSS